MQLARVRASSESVYRLQVPGLEARERVFPKAVLSRRVAAALDGGTYPQEPLPRLCPWSARHTLPSSLRRRVFGRALTFGWR